MCEKCDEMDAALEERRNSPLMEVRRGTIVFLMAKLVVVAMDTFVNTFPMEIAAKMLSETVQEMVLDVLQLGSDQTPDNNEEVKKLLDEIKEVAKHLNKDALEFVNKVRHGSN